MVILQVDFRVVEGTGEIKEFHFALDPGDICALSDEKNQEHLRVTYPSENKVYIEVALNGQNMDGPPDFRKQLEHAIYRRGR